MKSKEEFKKRFRYTLAGMAAYGMYAEIKLAPMERAAAMYDMPANVETLLDMIYDYLNEPPKGAK